MRKINIWAIRVFTGVLIASNAHSDGDNGFKASGYFNIDLGNIREGTANLKDSIYNEWYHGFLGGLTIEKQPMENLRLKLSVEVGSFQVYPLEEVSNQQDNSGLLRAANWRTYLEEGFAVYSIGAPESPFIKLEGGFFIYKYNPDAKVLGEYLFRSVIYPTLVMTKFNYAQSQIFGLRIGNALTENFHHDLFIQMEREPLHEPYYDLSFAYIANYNVMNLLEFGGGVRLRSAIAAKPSKTTPSTNPSAIYYNIPAQQVIFTDPIAGTLDTIVIADSAAGVYHITEVPNIDFRLTTFDTAGNEILIPEVSNGIVEYTFAGTLLMGRAAFNPMGFSEDLSKVLGKNAFKIYTETAVLGWKDYPRFYDNRRERIPVMFGFNLPTFNLIDDLSLEFEHLPLDTLPSYGLRVTEQIPLPGQRALGAVDFCGRDDNTRCQEDDWKWMVYARKYFPGFALVLQFGSDHMKRENVGGRAYDDIFTRPSQWYWQFRFTTAVK